MLVMAAPVGVPCAEKIRFKSSCIPLFVVEDHNEVLHHIYRSIGSKRLPLSGLTMVHLDSHPDMLIPHDLQAHDVFNKEKLFESVSIENWLIPAVYAGHISHIAWLKASWANQMSDQLSSFKVGRHKHSGNIRVTCKESYFVSELHYAHEDDLDSAKDLQLLVKTVDMMENKSENKSKTFISGSGSIACAKKRVCDSDNKNGNCKHSKVEMSVKHPEIDSSAENDANRTKTDVFSGSVSNIVMPSCDNVCPIQMNSEAHVSKETCEHLSSPLPGMPLQAGKPYILDIDLDFFSTQNPFKDTYSPKQYEYLQQLYRFEGTTSDSLEALNTCIKKREEQLSKLKLVFQAQQRGDPLPTTGDKDKDRLLSELVSDLITSNSSSAVDWEWLHEIGCTCDDTELPHHVSTLEQITDLVNQVKVILQKLPHPSIITMARSSNDDYCPKCQVETIQSQVINMLQELYGELDIHCNYEHEDQSGKE